MAPPFSKADLNKFCRDVQNEVTLICAKFGKDIFSISKVMGCKTKWTRFFGLPCIFQHANNEAETILKQFQCFVSGMCGRLKLNFS